jgi:hypothetical protein
MREMTSEDAIVQTFDFGVTRMRDDLFQKAAELRALAAYPPSVFIGVTDLLDDPKEFMRIAKALQGTPSTTPPVGGR